MGWMVLLYLTSSARVRMATSLCYKKKSYEVLLVIFLEFCSAYETLLFRYTHPKKTHFSEEFQVLLLPKESTEHVTNKNPIAL